MEAKNIHLNLWAGTQKVSEPGQTFKGDNSERRKLRGVMMTVTRILGMRMRNVGEWV